MEMSDIDDDQLVEVYNSSMNGHELFEDSGKLWEEIINRDINVDEYISVYDNGSIPRYDGENEETSAQTETESSQEEQTSAPVTEQLPPVYQNGLPLETGDRSDEAEEDASVTEEEITETSASETQTETETELITETTAPEVSETENEITGSGQPDYTEPPVTVT